MYRVKIIDNCEDYRLMFGLDRRGEATTKAINNEVLSRKEMTIEEVRKILGIKPKDLTEELEIIDVELREKEKDRLKW